MLSQTISDGAVLKEQDYQAARRKLAEHLGWSEVDPPVWQELRVNHDDLIQGAEVNGFWSDLEQEAKEIKRLLRGKGGHKSPPGRDAVEERPAWQLKDEELERSWVFSEYVAKLAAGESSVRRYRSDFLKGQTLSSQQAHAFLASPATATKTLSGFKSQNISLLKHTCSVKEAGRDDKGAYSLVEVIDVASGVTRQIKDRRPLSAEAWHVVDKAKAVIADVSRAREVKSWEILPFPGEDGYVHSAYAKPGSVLSKLHKVSGKLIERYPWLESEAVWFVLTGVTPWVAPLSFQARGSGIHDLAEHQFITMKVEPWVSEETVLRTYREAQLRLLRGDNRPAKGKKLRLLRFVTAKTDPATLTRKERASVAKVLVAEWDRENPNDTYGNDTRRFWRDYNQALLLVAQPMSASKKREREREPRELRRASRRESRQ